MPVSSTLLWWLFVRSVLLPHEPATLAVPPGELPSSRSVYGWLETTAPQIISDRFDSGGLTIGATPRLGVHGTSAADTTYRINGLDATSTLRPGAPMVLPDVVGATSISVMRLPSDVAVSAPGPMIDWEPISGATRTIVAEAYFMAPRWSIIPSTASALPIEQLKSMADGSLLISGELSPGKSNGMFAAHWARSNRLERASPTEITASQLSLVGHLTFTPTTTDELQATAIIQRASPYSVSGQTSNTDSYGTTQFTWKRQEKGHAAYRLTGGLQWTDTTPASIGTMAIDSAFDGAVFPAVFRPAGAEKVVRLAADVALAPRTVGGMTHRIRAWGSFDRSSMTPNLASASTVVESVNGVPARVWRVDVPSTPPSWASSTGALFATDRIGSEHAWIEVGMRAESMHASNGGATSISWSNVYPHVAVELAAGDTGFGLFGTYTRSGARLPAMALAYGDVNAPTARVYRWVDANANGVADLSEANAVSSLIARVGPGAAGGLTTVDPSLKRPSIDLFMGGIRFTSERFAFSATAIARREKLFVRAVADGGAAYSTVTQADPNADFTHPSDDQLLTGYSRTVSSFGLDHYTLTNPSSVSMGTTYTLDVAAQYRDAHTRLAVSIAAVKATGTAANRGFRADENDQGLIGEVPADPNATSFATNARNFFDRGYVGKIQATFTLPARVSLGVVTRYQDGQPFSRLAIFNNLTQGPEAVAAYANGRPTRFTYIATTDVRLQKVVDVGSGQVTVLVDAFNIFNIGREVEEYVLTNANFRSVTAIEPPRTLRLGLRFSF